jgi:hypothetical protein
MKNLKSSHTNGASSNRSSSVEQQQEILETTPSPFNPSVELIAIQSNSSQSSYSDSSSHYDSSPIHTSEASAPVVEGDDSSPEDELTITVERRFCDRCNQEIPIRAKHCKDCDHCIPLHDHHCPWLGICIGERNRFYFYWYLVLQTTELWWSLVAVTCSFEWSSDLLRWAEFNAVRVVCCVFLAFFTLMVSCLLCFHSYLALSNRTTCKHYAGEQVSWERITYLKSWPRNLHSPFSKGLPWNLYFYCCAPQTPEPTVWTMPNKLPDTPIGCL